MTTSKPASIPRLLLWMAILAAAPAAHFWAGLQASPLIVPGVAKPLGTPGLWLSSVKWKQPETGQSGIATFRVYCPTTMMRDVTNQRWGEARPVASMEGRGYPTGVPTAAYRQACH